jgi:CubicO group peptidase (beta-lactamase class C family)
MVTSYIRLIGFSFLVCIVILIGAAQVSAPTHTFFNVDPFCALVQELQQKDILDGEVFIAKGGDILLHEQSKEVAVCTQTGKPQFLIGSISKQFTAVALLHALYATSYGDTAAEKCACVEKQLHMPLSSFLPADASMWCGSMPTWAHEVTLHHLLTHTSGITHPLGIVFERSGFDGVWDRLSSPNTTAETIAISVKEPLKHAPGKEYAYFNEGYILLAEVISVISGVPFTRYMEDLCSSIGMRNTCHPDQGTWKQAMQQENCAHLMPGLIYSGINTELCLVEPPANLVHNFSNAHGSGGIISTIQDLIIWNDALHKAKTLLPLPLYELFIKPNLNDYGYGIWNKNGILFHGGVIDSYISTMMYISQEDLLIIALCHVNYDKTLEKTECLLDAALRKVISDKSEREQFVDKIIGELAEKHLAKRGGTLIQRWLMQRCFESRT